MSPDERPSTDGARSGEGRIGDDGHRVEPVRVGMITPSSNTVLEPVTYRMLGDSEAMSVHFSRIVVTEITMGERGSRQFETGPMLEAARLLSHARPDVITWNGTSASWLGLERDQALADAILRETGVAATTTVLGLLRALRASGYRRIAWVTPYETPVQERIVANYAAAGFETVAERHLGLSENHAFAAVSSDVLNRLLREVAAEGPEVVVTLCTNLDAASLAADFEQQTAIPLFDSVAVTLWDVLKLTGTDPAAFRRWGSLFRW